MTDFLQHGHTHSNSATPFGSHFLSSHYSSEVFILLIFEPLKKVIRLSQQVLSPTEPCQQIQDLLVISRPVRHPVPKQNKPKNPTTKKWAAPKEWLLKLSSGFHTDSTLNVHVLPLPLGSQKRLTGILRDDFEVTVEKAVVLLSSTMLAVLNLEH